MLRFNLLIPFPQILNHRRQIQLLILQQDQQVIHQIRCLILQLKLIVHSGRQRCFYTLFTHFLRDTLSAAGIQLSGVLASQIGGFTPGQQLLKLIQEQALVAGVAEAT